MFEGSGCIDCIIPVLRVAIFSPRLKKSRALEVAVVAASASRTADVFI